jgi:hypothetical protein
VGDSEKCTNQSFPACNGNPACTGTITFEVVANIGGACDGGNMVKITVDIDCGTAGVCKKTIYACYAATVSPTFCCAGAKYSTQVSPGSLGNLADGNQRCTTVTNQCNGICP